MSSLNERVQVGKANLKRVRDKLKDLGTTFGEQLIEQTYPASRRQLFLGYVLFDQCQSYKTVCESLGYSVNLLIKEKRDLIDTVLSWKRSSEQLPQRSVLSSQESQQPPVTP